MSKIETDAPHLVKTIGMVEEVAKGKGINLKKDKAQVVATFDFSGSTEDGYNTLYSDGTMEIVSELASAVGFTFDDDGQIPYSLFHTSVIDLGNLEPHTSQGFINRAWQSHRMGGTRFLPALRWFVETVGLGGIDLGRKGDPLVKKCTTPLAVYGYIVTDGLPQDPIEEIEEYLRRISQLPIFLQFIGVGNANFDLLKRLNNLPGTLIDNCGFFDIKDVLGRPSVGTQRTGGMFSRRASTPSTRPTVDDDTRKKMLTQMLHEFPSYYSKARQAGLVSN